MANALRVHKFQGYPYRYQRSRLEVRTALEC